MDTCAKSNSLLNCIPVRDITASNFGIAIAFLIPGFITLWGFSQLSPSLTGWMVVTSQAGFTIGGFLYVTLASLTLGLIASTIRWAVIDTIHHHTGVTRPDLEFGNLHDRTQAFSAIVEDRYRFYLFYGNSCVALPIATVCELVSGTPWVIVVPAIAVEALLLAGSRHSLTHYYRELAQLLGESTLTTHLDQSDGKEG